jgi:hypothetical protein
MAGDTLLVADTKANATKVFRHKGACIGIAGSYIECMEFVRWWKSGAKGSPPEMEEVDALVLTRDGRILMFNQHHSFFEIDDQFAAIGSGGAAALGAMHMGATPEQAIIVAGKVDPTTGGKPTIRRRGKKNAQATESANDN